jgi:hypothetical protein
MNISKCLLQNRGVISLGEFLVLMAVFGVIKKGSKRQLQKDLEYDFFVPSE